MNILLLGSGGREHTLAWKLTQSPLCIQLYTAPGNPGTAQCGQNVALAPTDFEGVANFIRNHQIDMLVVGSE
ncbi:phosphoribosylamine--glycine ligase N-terminal domain-containing protein, partial [Arthrospira platensis SPKY1]|nr:phosphoribosylamine--glycine ligase N-terminal domain-containing protein [Arthrospira platensis SPKY1]